MSEYIDPERSSGPPPRSSSAKRNRPTALQSRRNNAPVCSPADPDGHLVYPAGCKPVFTRIQRVMKSSKPGTNSFLSEAYSLGLPVPATIYR